MMTKKMAVKIIVIIIIIIFIIISFMQGIYTYIPETNYVPREYSVAAILLLLFMVLISLVPVLNPLYFYISTFRSMCIIIIIIIIIIITVITNCNSVVTRWQQSLHQYRQNK